MTSRPLILSIAAALSLLASIQLRAAEEPGYRSPLAVVASADGSLLYVAEQTGHGVRLIDTATGAVKAACPLAGPATGMALAADGKTLYATIGATRGEICAIDATTGALIKTICKSGYAPSAPVVTHDGKTLFVCNRFENDVSVIDLEAGKEIARVNAVREPVAAALAGDRFLFVANHLPAGAASEDYVGAAVTIIDTASRSAVKQIPLPSGSTGVRGICVSPDGAQVYVTHTLGRYNMPVTQVDHGWLNTNALSIIDAAEQRYVATILLDDLDRGAANPWGVACSPDGMHLCVTHAGTNELSIIDRGELARKLAKSSNPIDDLTFCQGLRRRIALPGKGSRGLCIAGSTAYVAEYFSDSIAAVNLSDGARLAPRSIALGSDTPISAIPIGSIVRRGEILFHDGTYCRQHWQSCSTCHVDARMDALNWDLPNDGFGNPKNTKSLLFAHQTPPAMITGTRKDAEEEVRMGMQFILFHPVSEPDATAIDAYLKSLEPLPSPHLSEGKLSASAERGRKLFNDAGCIACHAGPLYTDQKPHDVHTGVGAEVGCKYYTPSLIEAWRTAPYLHDGRAATVEETIKGHQKAAFEKLLPQDLADLVEFVLSL